MSFSGSVVFVTVVLSCQVLLMVIYVVIKAENFPGDVLVILTKDFSFLPRTSLSIMGFFFYVSIDG